MRLQEYPVKLLREMLETYSPSGSEADLARLIKTETESLGFKAHIDKAGNVIGEMGIEGPELLLCGHMDTVPGEIPVRLEDDFLYGRGAVDAKSSLATMIVGASRALREGKIPMRVRLACVVEEETTSKGFRTFLENGPRPQLAIFGEPSGSTNIIIGYKGRIQVEIECTTEGGHSASPWLFKNSAEEAYAFWNVLRASLLTDNSSSKFNAITGSLTRVATSGPENSIPAKTLLTVDIRLPPNTEPSQVTSRIDSLAQAYTLQNSGVQLRTIVKESTPAYLASPHSELVAACRGAIRRITGQSPSMLKKTGTSDMNLLSPGIRAIAYGPGDSSRDHTDREKIKISEYLKSIEIFAETLKLLSKLATPEIEITA